MSYLMRHWSVSKNGSTEAEDILGIRHQATTGEDADWENLVRAVVNYRVWELAIAP
jgi:hypothetical protein